MIRAAIRAIVVVVPALWGAAAAHAQDARAPDARQVILGTAASSGVYNQVGAAL